MKLLILILKKEELLDRILGILVETGFHDVSILDGENHEAFMFESNPVIASFRDLFSRQPPYNRTLLCPAPEPTMIADFVNICTKEGIPLQDPEIGLLLSLPCTIYTGSNLKDMQAP